MDDRQMGRVLGLNYYELSLFKALDKIEPLSLSELARTAKIPRSRSYDVIASLVHRGLAKQKSKEFKRPMAFLRNPDSLIIGNYAKQFHARLKAIKGALKDGK